MRLQIPDRLVLQVVHLLELRIHMSLISYLSSYIFQEYADPFR